MRGEKERSKDNEVRERIQGAEDMEVERTGISSKYCSYFICGIKNKF